MTEQVMTSNPGGAFLASWAAPSYVYAIGRVEPRFPSGEMEQEFAEIVRGAANFSKSENRRLARCLKWVLTVDGVDSFLLTPREESDVHMLIDAMRRGMHTMHAVIGIKMFQFEGGSLPIIAFDQIYALERCECGVMQQILEGASRAVSSDEERVLNYCAARCPDLFSQDDDLTGIVVEPASFGGSRKILKVIFWFTQRKVFVRVDVTDEFPFLVNRLSPYYES